MLKTDVPFNIFVETDSFLIESSKEQHLLEI